MHFSYPCVFSVSRQFIHSYFWRLQIKKLIQYFYIHGSQNAYNVKMAAVCYSENSELSSGIYCRVKDCRPTFPRSFYTAVYPRGQLWTSYSPPWELEISLTLKSWYLRTSPHDIVLRRPTSKSQSPWEPHISQNTVHTVRNVNPQPDKPVLAMK
jgi:hypothetical protein